MRVHTCALLIASCAIVVSSLPSGAIAQECDGWIPLHDMLPRRDPVLVQTSSGPLLYGGTLAPGADVAATLLLAATCETWRFDGARWQFVTMDGPSPRYQAAGVYDAARGKVVLFGGRGLDVARNVEDTFRETWEFAEGEWTRRITNQAPVGRYRHAMAYDPSRQKTFLYGGLSFETIASLQFWSYDGVDWTIIPLTTPNPGTQFDHSLIFDPRDNTLLLVPAAPGDAAWRWNGSAWTQLAPTGIQTSTAFFDSSRNAVVLGDAIGRHHTFDGSTGATLLADVEPALAGVVVNPTSIAIGEDEWLSVVAPPFNNFAESNPPSTLVYSPTASWTAVSAARQPTQASHFAMGFHPSSNEAVVFGGVVGPASNTIVQTWLLRGETWRRYAGDQPPARRSAFLAFVPPRNELIMLGGFNADSRLWAWNGASWSSTPTGNQSSDSFTPNPTLDLGRNAVMWPRADGLVIFDDERTTYPDLNLTSVWGAFDPDRESTVYTAGQASSTFTLGTGSGGDPILAPLSIASVPRAIAGVAGAYSAEYGGIVAFGGSTLSPGVDGPTPRKTYFLASDATAWSALTPLLNGPTFRSAATMVEDNVARRVIMYGGASSSSVYPNRETWKLARGPAAVALEPSETFVVPGETAEVFIIASGGGVIDYQWFKDGQPLANSPRISGADSDTLQIQNFSSDDNGQYHVTVSNPCGDDQSIAVEIRLVPACPGDFNDSGGIDASDLAAFFSAYEQGLRVADVDLSGGIDAGDLAVFIASYEAGGC